MERSRCDPFVLADDGVGAWRVDNVDVTEQLHRRGEDPQTIGIGRRGHCVTIFQHLDLRCGRCDTLHHHGSSQQAVDEGALTCVELTDDDDEKQLVELVDRGGQRCTIFRPGTEFGERFTQRRQQIARPGQLSLGAHLEYSQHAGCRRKTSTARDFPDFPSSWPISATCQLRLGFCSQ